VYTLVRLDQREQSLFWELVVACQECRVTQRSPIPEVDQGSLGTRIAIDTRSPGNGETHRFVNGPPEAAGAVTPVGRIDDAPVLRPGAPQPTCDRDQSEPARLAFRAGLAASCGRRCRAATRHCAGSQRHPRPAVHWPSWLATLCPVANRPRESVAAFRAEESSRERDANSITRVLQFQLSHTKKLDLPEPWPEAAERSRRLARLEKPPTPRARENRKHAGDIFWGMRRNQAAICTSEHLWYNVIKIIGSLC